jgi:hypothetical protein
MFSPRIARFRAAMILALAVLFLSDAALASFVCPHMSGCEHGMPVAGDSNAGTENAETEAMPCCPVKPESSMECGASAMECCAWHHSDSDVSAILFASDHPRPRHIVALLSAAIPAAPSLIARAHVPGLADDLAYAKPVAQKKTDLRI